MHKNHSLPQRQIHLDFHTSGSIPAVGSAFDPELFARTLADAHVQSVTLFARCHHGWLYYPSQIHPQLIHPHLQRPDLLGEQIKACRKEGLRVEVYTTVQWEEQSFKNHPEWAVLDGEGCFTGEKPFEPGFYGNLCVNTPYRGFLKEHITEILERFQPDGLFLDIVRELDCACRCCRRSMEDLGKDPAEAKDRIEFGRLMLADFKSEISAFVAERAPGCGVFYNGSHIGPDLASSLDSYGHLEVESLPSGSWGYDHYPLAARYARFLGKEHVGMTGKFHTYWGDFNTLKNRAALEYECFHMLALGGGISVGDQLPPEGRLDPATYRLLGEVFASAREKEPWCRDARPLSEAAILNLEEWEHRETPDAMIGAARLLQELGVQFDVVDSSADFTAYALLILPDRVPVDGALEKRLQSYIKNGGKILASFHSGLSVPDAPAAGQSIGPAAGLNTGTSSGTTEPVLRLPGAGFTLHPEQDPHRGEIDFTNSYAEYLSGSVSEGTPIPADSPLRNEPDPVCMYTTGLSVVADKGTNIRARRIGSHFHRQWNHYCSHQQTPAAASSPGPAWISTESTSYFAHPVFTTYRIKGARWIKTMVGTALSELLPAPLTTHDGPSSVKLSLMRQKDRYILHILHYIPEKRCEQIQTIEDIIPLYNLKIRLNLPEPAVRARIVPAGKSLEIRGRSGTQEILIPCVEGHCMVELSGKLES